MTEAKNTELTTAEDKAARRRPKLAAKEGGVLQVDLAEAGDLEKLFGLKTEEAANAILRSALTALGNSGTDYWPFVTAIAAEIEPTDAVEMMLCAQMVTTHVALATFSARVANATDPQARECFERSMTRLSRTFLAQTAALKAYRAKAQQTVRVERVVIEEGGQAVVGVVQHRGGASENDR